MLFWGIRFEDLAASAVRESGIGSKRVGLESYLPRGFLFFFVLLDTAWAGLGGCGDLTLCRVFDLPGRDDGFS